jgi:hypothetical protein
MPIPTLPSYHLPTAIELTDDNNILALTLILEDEEYEEAYILALGGPMPRVHPETGWFHNANKETGSPIFYKYIIDNSLKIIAPYY